MCLFVCDMPYVGRGMEVLVMPAGLQEERGGEIACLGAAQEVALWAELKPPRSEKGGRLARLAGEGGWGMQRRVKLSSAHPLSSGQAPGSRLR